MFDDDTGIIGRRIREIRSDRQMTLRQVAELAGFSPSYVSRLETGRRAVDKRKVLEPLAYALRVSPVDLTRDERDHGAGMGERRAHTALVPLEAALEIDLGDDPDVPARPWPEIAADIDRLQHLQHGLSDYNGQLELLPTLIPELHAALQQQPRYRNNILLALLHTYSSTMWSSKRLGAAGMPGLASRHAERMAAEAGDHARVAALADQVPVEIIPSPSRRAEFRMDTGRVLLDSKRTRDKGLRFLTLAHQEAPQRVANDAFTREAIANRLRAERREAGSRELRYLAHAVGLGPSGRR
ncbi:MAG: helix-turn-helix transcriptional regulator [Saccharopolyspora sp.]|uniref:helix-turn-helix domain-containing protein n=1 Tax=Saccharopolyspora TaxID=1835 RepID=UPI00190BA89A|nr:MULTISPECIES: helix-turn-helix transcriptional regulator [unclassified Saccharopolyspora]MBK0868995.1 helix-turn-helix transcriptional regulator [Saccharopolyspora sp. HNM0986]MBQ6644214.1 helix-turn-helix transcriptional regulator [Saccharopolyspora sp.]